VTSGFQGSVEVAVKGQGDKGDGQRRQVDDLARSATTRVIPFGVWWEYGTCMGPQVLKKYVELSELIRASRPPPTIEQRAGAGAYGGFAAGNYTCTVALDLVAPGRPQRPSPPGEHSRYGPASSAR